MSDVVRVILAEMRAEAMERSKKSKGRDEPQPFITISRMAGAGAHTLAENLARRLNAARTDGVSWHSFDRELVEMVARDHQISETLIESLEQTNRSWLSETLRGLKFADNTPSTTSLYRKVAESVLALARVGHTIIVGRGGGFITQALPKGTHVLVVAPIEVRAERMAASRNISQDEAARLIRQSDENRAAFYRQQWPDMPYRAETFTITLNSAMMSEQQMVDAVLPLIPADG